MRAHARRKFFYSQPWGFILAKTAREWPIRSDFTPRAAHHHRRQTFYLDSRCVGRGGARILRIVLSLIFQPHVLRSVLSDIFQQVSFDF